MSRSSHRSGLLLLALLAAGIPSLAFAQRRPHAPPQEEPATPPPAQTEEQQKAQQHFQRAKELYQQGSYREAIAELDIARSLDPKAKELVFNLGIVNERLGKFDEAIAWFQKYLEMGVTAQESARAESILKRIEGAKNQAAAAPTPTAPSPSPSTTEPPPAATTPREKGRIDTATIVAGSTAAVGLTVFAITGIVAVASRPGDFVTGRDGTYADLRAQTDNAHAAAVVADVALGVGLIATAATLYLYFSRPKDGAVGARVPWLLGGTF